MNKETIKAAAWGLVLTLIVASLIVLGSRNLAHFDAALVGYTFAVLFATFGITYRYSMWLQRPPTALYWKRGWQVFLRPRHLAKNIGSVIQSLTSHRYLRLDDLYLCFNQRLRNEGREIGHYFFDFRAAAGEACDGRRAGQDQRRDLFSETFDICLVLSTNADTQLYLG